MSAASVGRDVEMAIIPVTCHNSVRRRLIAFKVQPLDGVKVPPRAH